MRNAGFPKSARLLSSAQYKAVFDAVDTRVSSKHFLLLVKTQKETGSARMGIIVAKKHVKLAVGRNRIKRLLRETFRLRRSEGLAQNADIVVLAKKGAGDLDNKTLSSELTYLWHKLDRKLT